MATWVRPATAPPTEVERQEAEPAQVVLDVVREDPQEQQVAREVQPAAVQELARDERQRLHAEEADAAQAAVRSAGTTPQAVMNASRASSPPLTWSAELPGEGDEAGGDERRSSRPASGGSGSRPAAGSPGTVTPVRVRLTAWRTPRAARGGGRGGRRRGDVGDGLEARLVERRRWRSRRAGTGPRPRPGRRRTRACRPSRRPRRRAGTAPCRSRRSCRCDDPGVRLVVGVHPAGPPVRAEAAGHQRVDRGRAQERVVGGGGVPAVALARDEADEPPSLAANSVAVDVERAHPGHVPSRRQPRRASPGSRRRRPTASSAMICCSDGSTTYRL